MTAVDGAGERDAMIAAVLLVLGLMVIAALPEWPYSRRWGYIPTGTFSLLMVILMLLVIAGRI
jgi:hypothetical protein